MKQKLVLPLLLITVLFAVSCKKSGNTGLLVPKDAAIVFHINSSSLTSKLSWDEIQQTTWFKHLSKEATDSLAQQLLSDPAKSGIDTKADFVIFLQKQGKAGYVVFEGSLKDAAAFESLNKKIHDAGTSSKDGSVNYMTLNSRSALAWNSTHFTYVLGVNIPDFRSAFTGEYRGYSEDPEISSDSLKLFGKYVLNLKGSDKLDNDSRFVSMVKDGSDMHVWMNTEKYYGDMMEPVLSMLGNLSALTKDNVSTTSFNFEDGKMTMSSRQYYGKEMSSFMAKQNVKPVSTEMAARIPSDNVIGALAMNYPPEAIPDLFKLLEVDGFINMMMAKTGYSVEEFVKANKGEILFAVTDFQMKQKSDTFNFGAGEPPIISNSTQPDAKVFFATSVKDKAAFEKMLTLIWDAMKKDGPDGPKPPVTYKLENNWFAIGNSEEQVNQFLSGKSTGKGIHVDKISGHPFGMFIDLQRIFKAAGMDNQDSTAIKGLAIASNTWEHVAMWGGEYKDKSVRFDAEITMVDKKANSLKQLNGFIDKIATLFINQKESHKMMMMPPIMDTVIAPKVVK